MSFRATAMRCGGPVRKSPKSDAPASTGLRSQTPSRLSFSKPNTPTTLPPRSHLFAIPARPIHAPKPDQNHAFPPTIPPAPPPPTPTTLPNTTNPTLHHSQNPKPTNNPTTTTQHHRHPRRTHPRPPPDPITTLHEPPARRPADPRRRLPGPARADRRGAAARPVWRLPLHRVGAAGVDGGALRGVCEGRGGEV